MSQSSESSPPAGPTALDRNELLRELLTSGPRDPRLFRLYVMGGEVSRAIVRLRAPGELFSEICRVAVEIGGFCSAWLGTVEPDGRLAEAARCGAAIADPAGIADALWNIPKSMPATDQAVSVVIDDLHSDARLSLGGHQPAASAALVLLRIHGRNAAVFVLFSEVRGGFGAAERELLEETGTDLGRALEVLEQDTARKRVEEALSGSERRFRDMLERANLIAVMLDLSGSVTFCNEFGAFLLGWSRSEIIGKDWFSSFVPPEQRDSIRRVFLDNIRLGTIPVHFLNEVITRDGRRRAISWSNSVLCDPEGTTIGTASIGEDITERRDAEEAVRASEERYRLLFSANPLPMWVVDAETLRFLDANDAAVRQYGFTRGEFLAMLATDIHQPEEGPEAIPSATEGPPGARVVRHRKKSGAIITVELNSFEVMYGGRRARLVAARDVTEMKQLEEQLRQWQKMEAIGRLAGGVAHDFNNLLMAIKGYTELTLADLPPDHPHRADLEEVHKAAQRGAELTRQLLAFGRRQIMKPEILDLNSVVTEMNRILLRIIGDDVQLVTHLDPHLYRVRADRGQIGQVLLNLAVNARDAMPQGGTLTIETSNAHFNEEYARTHSGVRPGGYATIAVSDTGTGIPPNVMAHLFEPFFTTKDKDKGSGFGLSTVYGIVRQSGGHVLVNTEVDVGTTFRVYLPQVQPAAKAPAPNAKT